MRSEVHPYYQRYLALLLERALRPSLGESAWREVLGAQRRVIEVKERVWARSPAELIGETAAYARAIEAALSMNRPALKRMMAYRGAEERAEYTRLVMWRTALLEEAARIEALRAAHDTEAYAPGSAMPAAERAAG